MGCDQTFKVDEMCLAHQTYCEGIPKEKQDFRMSVLRLTFADHADKVIELTKQHEAKVKSGEYT